MNKVFVGLALFCLPFGAAAKSDLDAIWAEQTGVSRLGYYSVLNFNFSDLGNTAVFILYFIAAFGAMFAIITMVNGGLNLFLAGNNEDDIDKAKSKLIAGIGSFIMFVILFFSLDLLVPLVREWSARMA